MGCDSTFADVATLEATVSRRERHLLAADLLDSRIAILGAGAWGTALAVVLATHGRRVVLCVRRTSQLVELSTKLENPAYLPGVRLPQELELTGQWAQAVASADVVVLAVPSNFARQAFARVADSLRPDAVVISAVKGIEDGSLRTMSEMLAEFVRDKSQLAALSGPGFALEIARGQPAALVAASYDEGTAMLVQRLFAVGSLRIYRSQDVVGVEIGGVVKNVIAIAAGICDGLELGLSARAALITRGVAEMMRLGVAMGARSETLAGLAGLGDLVLTCTGDLSRNRSFGILLARQEQTARRAMERQEGPVAEGITNALKVRALAARYNVEMPIVEAVSRCLYDGESPAAMVQALLRRKLKAEFY